MPFAHEDATMIVWTNFLGRTPILQIASELGYSHLCGEFLWCKRPSTVKRVPVVFANATDKTTETAPNSSMKRFNQPASMISHVAGEGGGESRLSVVEFALVLRKSALPDLQPQDPPRCWSVVSGYVLTNECK
jgi:site-specific DNA-methyltransferase (adenine-specific)